MKVIVLFLLVVAAQARILVDGFRSIKAPILHSISPFTDPNGLRVVWLPTASPPLNPVVGYKVSMWEQKTKIVIEFEEIDGVLVEVETEKLVPVKQFTGEVPDWKPQAERVVPAGYNAASFYGIKSGITYEVRVQAFTLRETGPFSSPMNVMIQDDGTIFEINME